MQCKKTFRIAVLLILIVFAAVSVSGCACGVIYRAVSDTLQNTMQESTSAWNTPAPETASPTPSVSAHSSTANWENDPVAFSEMEYTRPNAEQTALQIAEITKKIADCSTLQELEPLFYEAETLYTDYDTMLTLASIKSSMDLSNAEWAAEEEYTSQGFATVDMAYTEFYTTLYDSPFREEVEQSLMPGFFDGIDPDVDWYPDGAQELYTKEAGLLSQYRQTLATATVLIGDQEMTYSDILDTEDADDYYSALEQWHRSYQPVLGDIYIDLVKTRQQLAQLLGFDSYTEMTFAQQGTDYTPEMMAQTVDAIVEHIVPLYATSSNYYIELDESFEDYAAFMQSALFDMEPSWGNAFQLMRDDRLIDYEPRAYKDTGAYTTYLSGYHSPFVLLSFTGDEYSMATLTHEFGHFYDFLVAADTVSTTDTAEIYSQALVLLLSNRYPDYFGEENGYMLQYSALYDAFLTFVNQPYYTAMELEIYAMDPDLLTIGAIDQIAQEQAERFTLTDGLSDDYKNVFVQDWVTVPHIYESPFYTFGYVTSADVAVQLWQLSQTDEQAALLAYEDLIAREDSHAFIENIQNAGLKSPFDPDAMERLAELFQVYLIDENWETLFDAA